MLSTSIHNDPNPTTLENTKSKSTPNQVQRRTTMKNFFDKACNIAFTCEGLKLLHQTLSEHSNEIIRQQECEEHNEPEGTTLGREVLKALRDCSNVDDDELLKKMPNLIFTLITERQIKESLYNLRDLILEDLKDEMEPLESTFHELTSSPDQE